MLRRRLSAFIALGILFSGLATAQASAFAPRTVFRYVVTFHDGVDVQAEANAMSSFGLNVARIYQSLLPGLAVDLTPDQAAALAGDPRIALVEQDVAVEASATQDGASWGLDRIDQRTPQLDAGYSYPASGGAGVVVYLVDSGLMVGSTSIYSLPHKELSGRVAAGYSWIEDGFGTDDCIGHGSHVAGIIAGTNSGVAKSATIIPARVLDCAGDGAMSDVVAALDWVQGSRDRSRPTVVNLSLSGPASQTLDNAIARLTDAGVTVVAAAGNKSADACSTSPGRAPGALTVGATNSADYRADSSNFGPCLDLFAPGTLIPTISNKSTNATTTFAGTSAAAAIVTGVVALLLGDNPGLTPAQVHDRLMAAATPGVVLNPGEGSPTALVHVVGVGS